MIMSLRAANSKLELRHLNVHCGVVNQPRIFDVIFVALEACQDPRFGCSLAGWLHLSLDGGLAYVPVPASVQTGVALGAMAMNASKAAKLKLLVPVGTTARGAMIEFWLGEGV